MESLRLTTTLPVSPGDLYDAWTTGVGHSAMTGSAATSTKKKGGAFTAWNGYIKGEHLELQPGKRILQAWRTTEFPKDAPDSLLELRLEASPEGTRLVLLQGGIPNGQSEMYTEGWQEHYFTPMRKYFSATRAATKKPPGAAAKKPGAKKPGAKKPGAKKPGAKKPVAKKAKKTNAGTR